MDSREFNMKDVLNYTRDEQLMCNYLKFQVMLADGDVSKNELKCLVILAQGGGLDISLFRQSVESEINETQAHAGDNMSEDKKVRALYEMHEIAMSKTGSLSKKQFDTLVKYANSFGFDKGIITGYFADMKSTAERERIVEVFNNLPDEAIPTDLRFIFTNDPYKL